METIKLLEVGGCDDYLEACYGVAGRIQIECVQPWAGDTEGGYGQGGTVQLTKEQAIKLGNWLLETANNIAP